MVRSRKGMETHSIKNHSRSIPFHPFRSINSINSIPTVPTVPFHPFHLFYFILARTFILFWFVSNTEVLAKMK
ncbi:hypothetical protein BpHYR1_016555 [Brachionus plicatilis]|uniref:Uncharacterized protein n=1 Tax=Brachionus plicatilis TaxID=10195 RepID=A0A3M7T2Z2_BRAPC|nr:hypothetical protein BpHYR1_016555 [Brachionus plicatilis]